MDVPETREMMVRQATGMIVSMVSVVVSTLKRLRDEPEPDTDPNPLMYSLRADAEQHRQRTLQAIYNSTDVECVSMLRMRRKPFFVCVRHLDLRGFCMTMMVLVLRNRLQCSFMLLGTIRDLGWCTSLLGGPLRQFTNSFTKFCLLLVSLGLR
jgi:hypothetical protein